MLQKQHPHEQADMQLCKVHYTLPRLYTDTCISWERTGCGLKLLDLLNFPSYSMAKWTQQF